MIKYFYFLYFQYFQEDGSPSNFFQLGLYSSKKKAQESICFFKDLVGFNKHPLSCFHIKRVKVNFNEEFKCKSDIYLYKLSYSDSDGYDQITNTTLFGYFEKRKFAIMERDKQLQTKKFSNKSFFNIEKIKIDENSKLWDEGFTPI